MLTAITSHRLRLAMIALLAVLALAGTACSDSSSAAENLPDLGDVPGADGTAVDGDIAPDFTVDTLDGTGFTLSEHLENDGRPVFLNMWASWCPPCRAEMPDIDAAADEHTDVKFVGVAASDEPASAADFATSIHIGYTIGFDEHGVVAREYNIPGLPASYIISADGVIVEKIFGAVTQAQIDEKLESHFG
ncbi:MAG: TlpA disulfide reductase family protein [Actinomycetota bacterium]